MMTGVALVSIGYHRLHRVRIASTVEIRQVEQEFAEKSGQAFSTPPGESSDYLYLAYLLFTSYILHLTLTWHST